MLNNPQWPRRNLANPAKIDYICVMEISKLIERKTLAAGPCSAETEPQTLAAAQALALGGLGIFRAGLWKPRTNAGQFEGVGEAGIPWMLKARKITGMRLATEVATPRHADLCADAGFDILWIGARTVSNPFAVQELAEALRGFEGEIWIKNPISPELPLWIGAFNRFEKQGLTRLSAVHRGFSNYDRTIYRNLPRWDIPVELRQLRPDTKIICDPSHIGGSPDLIEPLAQYALDLDFDGLMIESHPEPCNAWSDATQQVTPSRLLEILRHLRVKKVDHADSGLSALRARIDECDAELLSLLARRMHICREIGELKKEENIPVLQSGRYAEMLRSRLRMGDELGVDPEFTKEIFDTIHHHSIALQVSPSAKS